MSALEDWLFGQRIRQNHALEHATVTILSRMIPDLRVSARSNKDGFVIYGDVDLRLVRDAANEALRRLQQGEAALAIHPNCGTNLAVGTSLAAIGSLIGLSATRPRTRAISLITAATTGLAAARPIGQVVQKYMTTLPDQQGVRVTSIVRKQFLRWPRIEVRTMQE
jgi:hypothetical protein